MGRIEQMMRYPIDTQHEMWSEILRHGKRCDFGRRYEVDRIESIEDFQTQVPLSTYDTMGDYLQQMLNGEADVTARGRIEMFARSSGTTSGRSKYIPVTHRALWGNHLRGMRDVVTLYLNAYPDSRILDGKTLTLGGFCSKMNGALVGDLSALLIYKSRAMGGWFRLPRTETALLPDFDEKVERICRECCGENITSFAGVPSWNLALMRRVLEFTGRTDLREVWSGLELFVHGGVGFLPYRKAYAELFPSGNIRYMESYNASEGFFAIADDPQREDMLLMLDYGTFYEFRSGESVVPLEGVSVGIPYAMIITSTNGLWRYEIGDLVEFTSTDPYRIRIVGRTKQYINVFGEELILDNVEKALERSCRQTGIHIEEYTVAPRYMTTREAGAHEWLVEFTQEPVDIERFADAVDSALISINSDYEAKRRSTMTRLRIEPLPRGTIQHWLAATGRNKVPRLSNDRRVVDEIKAFVRRANSERLENLNR